MNLPGTWLLALSKRYLDEDVVRSTVLPTIADLQHETLAAGDSRWLRWMAVGRGYSAVVRLLFQHSFIWRSPMRGVLAVFVLGIVGAVASVTAFSMRLGGSDAGLWVAFLLMAVLAPLVIRRVDGRPSYRRMLLACMGVGMVMGTALFGWIALVDSPNPAMPWYGVLWRYLFLTAFVVLASALASAAAWKPAGRSDSMWRRWFLDVLVGASAYAVCECVIVLCFAFVSGWDSNRIVLTFLRVSLLAFYFAGFLLVVYVPVLGSIKRVVPHVAARLPLALIGAILFPIPVLARDAFLGDGRFLSGWNYWLQHPSNVLWESLPYLVAGAVLGWLLAARPQHAEVVAS
jgi:hypothetical protein